MKIINADLLNRYRGPGRCEHCGLYCKHREAAHVSAKGMGAGKQVDVPINLIALGGPFSCGCHAKSHTSGRPYIVATAAEAVAEALAAYTEALEAELVKMVEGEP